MAKQLASAAFLASSKAFTAQKTKMSQTAPTRNFLHVDVNSVCFVVHLRSIWDPGILPSGHIVKALLARKG